MEQYQYRGNITPLITPLDEKDRVCKESVKRLIDWVGPHSSALMPNLTSGEGWKLSAAQWQDMLDYTIEYSGGLPVIAGVEHPDTESVIKYAEWAKTRGADAIIVTSPFSKGLTQEGVLNHFTRIVESITLPVFVYNEEAISGVHIELHTMLKLCELKGIVGVKEASGDAGYSSQLIANASVPIFQGWENLAIEEGIAGYIFPLSNLEPELCKKAFERQTPQMQLELNIKCREYQLLDAAPYKSIKRHLFLRNIIRTDRVV